MLKQSYFPEFAYCNILIEDIVLEKYRFFWGVQKLKLLYDRNMVVVSFKEGKDVKENDSLPSIWNIIIIFGDIELF